MLNKPRPTVVIFSQGDEVITGATVDSNAAWLSQHCSELGFDIIRHVTVADELSDLINVLHDIDEMADICLCTGGLGPTQDDLTSEAFSAAFNAALALDEDALVMMAGIFSNHNMPMPEVNRKQAYLPKGSRRIDNHWGTAPGFVAKGQRCRFYFMPGVPYEMKNMMHDTVIDDLKREYQVQKTRLITLRTMGLGESAIQQRLNELTIPDDVRVSFRAGLPENELKLIFPYSYNDVALRQCVDMVSETLGHAVFAIDGLDTRVASLPDCVHQLMTQKKCTLGVIETLSQGTLARQCDAGWLSYAHVFPNVDNALRALSVVTQKIDEEGAIALAKSKIETTSVDMVLVQLYKQINSNKSEIFTAVVDNSGLLSSTRELSGRAERQQIVAAATALNLVRKKLLTV